MPRASSPASESPDTSALCACATWCRPNTESIPGRIPIRSSHWLTARLASARPNGGIAATCSASANVAASSSAARHHPVHHAELVGALGGEPAAGEQDLLGEARPEHPRVREVLHARVSPSAPPGRRRTRPRRPRSGRTPRRASGRRRCTRRAPSRWRAWGSPASAGTCPGRPPSRGRTWRPRRPCPRGPTTAPPARSKDLSASRSGVPMSCPAQKCLPAPASTMHRDLVVVHRAGEGRVQRVGHRGVLRVAVLRPVQGDQGDPAALLVTDLVRHHGSPLSAITALSQHSLEYLARRVAGQGVAELHPPGHLVVGQPLAAERQHVRRVQDVTGSPDDERPADLAESRVGHADDGRLRDPVQPGQHLLHLGGVDVEAAADVHVLEPVGDRQVPGGVEPADVAGVQPAVRVDGALAVASGSSR